MFASSWLSFFSSYSTFLVSLEGALSQLGEFLQLPDLRSEKLTISLKKQGFNDMLALTMERVSTKCRCCTHTDATLVSTAF